MKFKKIPKDLIGDILVYEEILEKNGSASITVMFRIQHTDWRTGAFQRKPRGVLTIVKNLIIIILSPVICFKFKFYFFLTIIVSGKKIGEQYEKSLHIFHHEISDFLIVLKEFLKLDN